MVLLVDIYRLSPRLGNAFRESWQEHGTIGVLSRIPRSGSESISVSEGYCISSMPFRMKTRGAVSFENLLSKEPGLVYVSDTYVVLPVRSKRCLEQ